MARSYRTLGISWPNEKLLRAAKRRAQALGLSLSKYVNELVERDVEGGGDFILRERSRTDQDRMPILRTAP